MRPSIFALLFLGPLAVAGALPARCPQIVATMSGPAVWLLHAGSRENAKIRVVVRHPNAVHGDRPPTYAETQAEVDGLSAALARAGARVEVVDDPITAFPVQRQLKVEGPVKMLFPVLAASSVLAAIWIDGELPPFPTEERRRWKNARRDLVALRSWRDWLEWGENEAVLSACLKAMAAGGRVRFEEATDPVAIAHEGATSRYLAAVPVDYPDRRQSLVVEFTVEKSGLEYATRVETVR